MIRQRHHIKRYTSLRRSRKPIRRDARTAEERRRDREWRADVLREGGYRCRFAMYFVILQRNEVGPCFGPLDPHHIKGKATKALRWDVSNGVPLCRAHHDWAHAHPKEAREMFG